MIEVAHWSALLPLLYMAAFRRGAPGAYWLVAVAFACSFVGDTAASIMHGSWAAERYYLVAQYGLFLLAVPARGFRSVMPSVVMYAGVGSLLYVGMMRYATEAQAEQFLRWWYPYQSVRLASFGLFGWAAWRRA